MWKGRTARATSPSSSLTVWSPEHGVQLAVRVEDGPADGPGHSVAHLRAFHARLGEELERLLEDHPEQAGYWSGE